MSNLASILETLMIITFGASWPINLSKAWRARSTKGISIAFYTLIFTGYIFGIVSKCILIAQNAPAPWYETVRWYVLFFYVLNLLMVGGCIVIYFRNRRIEQNA